MTIARLWTGVVLTGALLLGGCATSRFQIAAGRFGTETSKAMAVQSEQIKKVSERETQRLRDRIVADRTRIGLHDDCQETEAGPDGKFKPCTLVAIPPQGDETPLDYQYELPAILALQDALGEYGDNLALLADAAEEDQAAFSTSIDKLGASIGKLDAAIAKAASTSRVDSDGKIGTIASAIGAIGNLAYRLQRRHALRRIIIANDPLVQEALDVLRAADKKATEYKRTAALRIAQAASTKAALAGSDDERRKRNDELYGSVDLLNAIGANTPKLERLAAVHAALATVARNDNLQTRTALAREMLTDWTRD